jgi:hypothetical protein
MAEPYLFRFAIVAHDHDGLVLLSAHSIRLRDDFLPKERSLPVL